MSHAKLTRGWWFILPSLLLLFTIVGVPLYYAARYSLHEVLLFRFRLQPFVGLENYQRLLEDPLFLGATRTTIVFTLANTVLAVLTGLLIAFLLSNRAVRYKSLFMAFFLLPFVMTQVVTGVTFRLFIWEADFGLVNYLLGALNLPTPGWLIERHMALPAAVLTNVWRLTPLALLVLYAALSTLSEAIIEAARIDGAGTWTLLSRIIVPQIRHHILFVSLIIITSAFREFDTIFTLTGGGPGRQTTVLSILAYNRGITNQDMGYANAIAFSMFLIVGVLCWLYITVFRVGQGGEA